MIILMGIALTILCICSVMELALTLFFIANQISFSKKARSLPKKTQFSSTDSTPAPATVEDEALAKARKRYEEEMSAFQDLMNYNANVAYGIEPMEDFKE